jgi:hypothetical protein
MFDFDGIEIRPQSSCRGSRIPCPICEATGPDIQVKLLSLQLTSKHGRQPRISISGIEQPHVNGHSVRHSPSPTPGGTPIKLKTKPDPSQHYTCNKFGTHSPTAATRKYNNKPKKKGKRRFRRRTTTQQYRRFNFSLTFLVLFISNERFPFLSLTCSCPRR